MRRAREALVLTGVLVFCPALVVAADPDVVAIVRATTNTVIEGDGGPGAVEGALVGLVDVAGRIARQAPLADAAVARIEEAATSARRRSPLDPRSRAAIGEAYAAVNRGRAFEFPSDVASIEQAKQHGRGQVDRCLAALADGRREDAVRELLGFVLLVITPVEAKQ